MYNCTLKCIFWHCIGIFIPEKRHKALPLSRTNSLLRQTHTSKYAPEGGNDLQENSQQPGKFSLAVLRDLFEEALPGFLVFAEALLHVLENALEVGIGAEVVPGGILLEPGIVLVAEIDGAA